MAQTSTSQFTFNNKTLNVFCVSLHGEDIPAWVSECAREAFEPLAPFIQNENQVLYVRDIPFLTIDKKYPGGYCYNEYEATVALLNWRSDKQQIQATFNHELHHLARWQNPGYGETLGGAILSEGIATFYADLMSGWSAPWGQASISKNTLEAALKEWDSKDYDHTDWFFDGSHGRWAGYGLGYRLAAKIFADGFDLAKSINLKPEDVKDLALQINIDH